VGAYVVAWVGASPARLLFGVMAATAFISMWVSNTATAMMMLPIALAALAQLGMQPGHDGGKGRLAAAVMLGVAYAASIGGVATLVGTPPNLIFIGQARELAPDAEEVTFLKWMAFALPMALGFLLIAWAYLAFVVARVPKSESIPSAAGQSPAPARWSRGELGVLAVFLVTVVAWIWRADIDVGAFTIKGWSTLAGLKDVQDGTIAMAAALALFLLPADWKKREFLLDWDWARRLPWDVLLLFGGGFALAEAFQATGLGAWLASGMDGLEGVPTVLVVAVVCLFTTFLSELMSNTAIAALMMPVMAATATALGIHPYTLMVPAAISASFSFMLPTGTPPNAIVFGSGHVTMRQMARSGLALNLLGVVWVTLLMYVLVIPVLGLD
jgi:sodium-dependent dicarboxylate transporter 2/3/5